MAESCCRRVSFVGLIVVLLFGIPLVCFALTPNSGSLRLIVHGRSAYYTFNGKLENAIIQPNDSVSMIMVLNEVQASNSSSYPVNASATWSGIRRGSTLSGQIRDLVGKVCVFSCFDLTFVGVEGQWSGMANQTHASGTLQGTVNITRAPSKAGIPIGLAPFSGTWTADFQLPVPESSSLLVVYVLVTVTVSLFVRTRIRPEI